MQEIGSRRSSINELHDIIRRVVTGSTPWYLSDKAKGVFAWFSPDEEADDYAVAIMNNKVGVVLQRWGLGETSGDVTVFEGEIVDAREVNDDDLYSWHGYGDPDVLLAVDDSIEHGKPVKIAIEKDYSNGGFVVITVVPERIYELSYTNWEFTHDRDGLRKRLGEFEKKIGYKELLRSAWRMFRENEFMM